MSSLHSPILFLVFNRPEKTRQVFESIRKAQPKQLFVAADGPRKNVASDAINCLEVRKVIEQVDWSCEIKTLFREQNLGCRVACSSAIDWFFSQVEEGIILEDDILPHPDFFQFVDEMLEKYRDDNSIMHITGGNFQFGKNTTDYSYYFSRGPHVWGWASWRRAWKHYDVDMKDYPEFLRKNKKESIFINEYAERYWLYLFNKVYHKSNTWDYQWGYAIMKNRGYCIIPNVNLISNIGFDEGATHALDEGNPLINMKTYPLSEIKHPPKVEYFDEADKFTVEVAFPIPTLLQRIVRKLNSITKKIFS